MNVQSTIWLSWATAGVIGHWIVPSRFRDLYLIVFTLVFLYVYSPVSAGILVTMTLVTYGLTRGRPVSGISVTALGAAIVGTLAVFKITQRQIPMEPGAEFVIPLGLSYYALRCLHYGIERYKGTLPDHNLFDFFSYQFFLPTIIAGPIHRFPEFYRDQHRRRWDAQKFSRGLERMLFGYVKIVVLGNFLVSQVFAEFVNNINESNAALFVYLDLLRHSLNLYFQFSGYSDVAIGLGMLFGFKVMENFNWPFLQKNISDFWKSWHISLTGWCREYIYMVVIATRRSPTLAAITTMLAIGFWHEISFRYFVWGVYHGLGVAAWQMFQRIKPQLPTVRHPMLKRVLHLLSVLLTFHFVVFGFSIVQGPDLASAVQRWQTLFISWWI